MDDEYLFEAREELKRLEHTIYVTLKYTRTVDVIKSTLKRLIGIFDIIIDAILDDAKEKELITTIPKSPSLKSVLVTETYPEDERLGKYITFYAFLREALLAKHSRREEFRRHVTLISDLGNKSAELDIDNLGTYEIIINDFFIYAKRMIKGEPQEGDEDYD
ncbi:hypothetical protein GOV03_02220 [Candidatus Woesearchaeota archaeon]|nr:hypothetical protein [Candidatus Woesearchaeota archaeon]